MSLEEALNPNTPADRLQEILDLENKEICQALATNPNSPPELLIELFERYPIEVLNNPVLDLILLEIPNFFDRLQNINHCWIRNENEGVFFAIISNKNTQLHILEKLAIYGDERVRSYLAKLALQQKIPIQILKLLATDRSPKIRLAVAKNPNINPTITKLIFENRNYAPNTSDRIELKQAIELEIMRLNWTKERARQCLYEKYSYNYIFSLENEQLLEFWQYLSSLK